MEYADLVSLGSLWPRRKMNRNQQLIAAGVAGLALLGAEAYNGSVSRVLRAVRRSGPASRAPPVTCSHQSRPTARAASSELANAHATALHAAQAASQCKQSSARARPEPCMRLRQEHLSSCQPVA